MVFVGSIKNLQNFQISKSDCATPLRRRFVQCSKYVNSTNVPRMLFDRT